MKDLFIIRHAKSSWENPSFRDIDRPLNKRGKKDALFMSRFMDIEIGARPDIIYTSHAKRAQKTAEAFAEYFELSSDKFCLTPDLYEAPALTYQLLLESIPDTFNQAIIVGHNPGITEFVNYYTSNYIDNVPTGGIIHLREMTDNWSTFHPAQAKMLGSYFPKLVQV